MLNIRTLQILVEVARQGGFSRAAQTVHAVQPTVSKAVQAVEDRLGVRIFERANNGVRLTVEGEIVYRRALNILQEFEALEADVAALHKLEKGVLRIGFPPVASGILFADLLSKYRQLYPAGKSASRGRTHPAGSGKPERAPDCLHHGAPGNAVRYLLPAVFRRALVSVLHAGADGIPFAAEKSAGRSAASIRQRGDL